MARAGIALGLESPARLEGAGFVGRAAIERLPADEAAGSSHWLRSWRERGSRSFLVPDPRSEGHALRARRYADAARIAAGVVLCRPVWRARLMRAGIDRCAAVALLSSRLLPAGLAMNAPLDPTTTSPEPVRVDKWLWAARVFKTRSIAQQACRGGHVTVNGHAAQPAKVVRIGDRIEVQRDERRLILEVAGLGERRGPAPLARQLYVDRSPPPPPRPEGPFVIRDRGAGRPTKRDRRAIGRMRGR